MSRRDLVPNANNPALLTRLLRLVGRGVRTTRGLQEVLGVELRTVQYYTQAAEWLGLLDSSEATRLTPLGLQYVYGDDPAGTWAQAIWGNSFVRELLETNDHTLPTARAIAEHLLRADPSMAPATAERRATAVRSLVAPIVGRPRPRSDVHPEQLSLPLAPAVTAPPPPQLQLRHGREHDPDVYRYLLSNLLDHGELGLGQVRALLDHAGVGTAPIGGYVDLAVARGDGRRVGERIVATSGAVGRRDILETTTSVILSDAGYRRYLDDLLQAATGDRQAEIRRDGAVRRYRVWDHRLFGHAGAPHTLERDLAAVLMDRSLASFPTTTGPMGGPPQVDQPFLDALDQELVIALPPTLLQLKGGVSLLNAVLRRTRAGAAEVALPSLGVRPVIVHGGVLHPGEPLPRSIPDARSLRLRTVMHAPWPAMLTALALLHRSRDDVGIARVRGTWCVRRGRRPVGPLLELLDAFAARQGWLSIRRRSAGVTAQQLVDVLCDVGLLAAFGDAAILDEAFFGRLRSDAEEMEVHARLLPLVDAIEHWLFAADGPAAAESA